MGLRCRYCYSQLYSALCFYNCSYQVLILETLCVQSMSLTTMLAAVPSIVHAVPVEGSSCNPQHLPPKVFKWKVTCKTALYFYPTVLQVALVGVCLCACFKIITLTDSLEKCVLYILGTSLKRQREAYPSNRLQKNIFFLTNLLHFDSTLPPRS